MTRRFPDEPAAPAPDPAPTPEPCEASGADPTQTHVARELTHDRPLICCAFDPTGRFVFAGSEDLTVRRWDLDAAEEPTAVPFAAHESWVFDLALTPDGRTLLSAGGDGRLLWWPAAAEGEPVPDRQVEAHDGWVRGVTVSLDGRLAASCGNDRRIKIWSIEDGSLLHDLTGAHDKPIYAVGFHPDGESLVSADLEGRIVVWEVGSGLLRHRLDASSLYSYNAGQQVDYGGVRDLAFSPSGDRLACAGLLNATNPLGAVNDPAVVLFDGLRGEQIGLLKAQGGLKGVAWGVRFHPDGFLAVAVGGSGGGHLLFYRPDQPDEEFHRFSLPNTARALDLHPDGLQLATAHHDGKLRLSRMQPQAQPEAS
ncbi:WD40 repeat domain-containing protein [Tautonia marina]|uniref:WD40 repeat domain-containing protein n=1 Tax=Tautonia marina TaxID=2653855 RepID=UPI0012604F7E|nr:WD40 repeat domain-containing protein [Tautonia marina]